MTTKQEEKKLIKDRYLAAAYATPVGVAVKPLRDVAQDNAEERAREVAASVAKDLAAAGGDINQAAPYPDYFKAKTMSRFEVDVAKARYSLFHSLVKADPN